MPSFSSLRKVGLHLPCCGPLGRDEFAWNLILKTRYQILNQQHTTYAHMENNHNHDRKFESRNQSNTIQLHERKDGRGDAGVRLSDYPGAGGRTQTSQSKNAFPRVLSLGPLWVAWVQIIEYFKIQQHTVIRHRKKEHRTGKKTVCSHTHPLFRPVPVCEDKIESYH